MKFCEVSIDIIHRNIIKPVEELPEFIRTNSIKNGNNHSLYRSVWLYDEEINDHLLIRKTVSSFRGKYYIDKLIFDIDTKDRTYPDTKGIILDIVEGLTDDFRVPIEAVRIWFSGTGFHITVPDFFGFKPDNNLPKVVKATLGKYFPNADSSIYSPTGLIRMANTINTKSNLYKIPLTVDEFTSMQFESIKELAVKPRKMKTEKVSGIKKNSDKIIIPFESKALSLPKDDSGRIVTCMQKLYARGPVQGARHMEAMRLVSSWRRGGISLDGSVALLLSWLEGEDIRPYEVKHIVSSIYEKGYSYSCIDPVYASLCDSRCIYYKNKNYSIQVDSIQDVARQYTAHLQTISSGGGFDLGLMYGSISYRVLPQELVIFIGDTKVGKTALVQNICIGLPQMRILYMSLEVGAPQLYRRFVQVAYGFTKTEADDNLTIDPMGYTEKLQHIQIVTIPPKLEDVVKIITQSNVQMVVIDTLDGIIVEGARDETALTKEIVMVLKELANRLNVVIIGIHHISKHAVAKTDKLNKHSGKGSSSIEQKADKVIAIEPGKGNRRVVRTLASRDERDIMMPFVFDGDTFRFERVYETPLSMEEE